MRIEFLVGKDDRRLARRIVRRLPVGVRIGEPARLEDDRGRLIGWAIDHPDLTEIDAIRLRYVMDVMASDDPALAGSDLDVSARELRARIDAVPEVQDAIRAYRKLQREQSLM